MTVTIHLGGRIPRFGEKQHFLPDMVMSKLAMAEPIAILIFNGVFQRFPKLRFVTVESGVGWFSFMAEYMDRTWEKQSYWTDSALTETDRKNVVEGKGVSVSVNSGGRRIIK